MLPCVPGLTESDPKAPPERAAFVGTREATKKHASGETFRARPLDVVLALARRDAELAGITRLADLTGLDATGIHAFSSIRPTAEEGSLTVTGGKGRTADEARVSALLEGVERWCAERNGRQGPTATYGVMAAEHRALDPRSLLLPRDHEYREDSRLEWWPTRDLFSDHVVWVPAAAIFHPYDVEPYLFPSNSSGLSLGNTLEEATYEALLEIVERDTCAMAEVAVDEGSKIALDSIDDPVSREFLRGFDRANVRVDVRVFLGDVGIPLFFVTIEDLVRQDAMFLNGGFGCDLDPVSGLRKALSEAAFTRATVISGARDDLEEVSDRREVPYDEFRRSRAGWLDADLPIVPLSAVADHSTRTLTDDIEQTLRMIERAGFRSALVSELTLPRMNFAVVKAVLPGAERPDDDEPRFGARRARRVMARLPPQADSRRER